MRIKGINLKNGGIGKVDFAGIENISIQPIKTDTADIGEAFTPLIEMGDYSMSNGWHWLDTYSGTQFRTPESLMLRGHTGDIISFSDYTKISFAVRQVNEANGTYSYSGWKSADFALAYTGAITIFIRTTEVMTADEVMALITFTPRANTKADRWSAVSGATIDTAYTTKQVHPVLESGNVTYGAEDWAYSDDLTSRYFRTPERYTLVLHAGDTVGLSSYSNVKFKLSIIDAEGTHYNVSERNTDYKVGVDGVASITVHTTGTSSAAEAAGLLSITPYNKSAEISREKVSDDILNSTIYRILPETFEAGSINTGGGDEASTKRGRTKSGTYIYLQAGAVIEPYGDYPVKLSYHRYNAAGTHTGSIASDGIVPSGYWTDTFPFTLKYTGYYRFVYQGSYGDISQDVLDSVGISAKGGYVYSEDDAFEREDFPDDALDSMITQCMPEDFVVGSISSGGADTVSTNQARTIAGKYYYVSAGTLMEPKDDGTEIEILYRRYDSAGKCIGNNASDQVSTGAWINKFPTALPYTGYYRFAYNKRPVRAISDSDLASIGIMLYGKNTKRISNIIEGDGIDYDKNVHAVAHRGYDSIAPENTFPAFMAALQRRWKYVETDVQFTADDVPILLHDNTINRTARNADGTQIAETYDIRDITYTEACAYDFGIKNGDAFAGTKIPRFDDFVDYCKATGLHPYIELKERDYITSTYVEGLVDIVKSRNMLGAVTWISSSVAYLGYVKNADSHARLGVLTSSVTAEFIAQCQSLLTGSNEVFVDSSSYGDEAVALCKNAGLPLEVWTLDAKELIEGMDPYITGVTSDSQHAGKILFYKAFREVTA